jgi:hypothetical protein
MSWKLISVTPPPGSKPILHPQLENNCGNCPHQISFGPRKVATAK